MSLTNSTSPTSITPAIGLTNVIPVGMTANTASQQAPNVSIFPTAEAQLELWLQSCVSNDANCAFNETATLRLHGSLRVDVLRKALDAVMMRHEMLRATFSEDGQTVHIHSTPKCDLTEVDLSDRSKTETQALHAEAIQHLGRTPFDLMRGPLLRFRLVKLGGQESWLTISAHHLVLDGWSVFVLCRDLGHLYSSQLGAEVLPPPVADSYHAYADTMAKHEASEAGKNDIAFWKAQFADGVPNLELPTDRPRPALKTFASSRYDYRIEAANVQSFKKAGAKCGCSLFNFVVAGFQSYLARVTGQDDFSIGIPTAGQSALGSHNLIGHCVNTLPIRAKIDRNLTVSEFVKQMRGRLLDALDHQRCTFGRIVRSVAPPRDASRPTMFPVMINIDPAVDETEFRFSGLDCKLLVEPREFENFEWFISGVNEREGALELQCQFNSDLFDVATIANHLEGFETHLIAMATGLATRVDELPTLSLRQREQIVVSWNATEREYSRTTTVHAEFLRQSAATPDRIAVTFGNQSLTYLQLQQRSSQLARFLIESGVRANDRVGLCLPRSETMLVSALAVWQAGATYVPLDPAYPLERLQMVCEDAELKRIIIDADTRLRLPTQFQSIMIDVAASSEAVQQCSVEEIAERSTPRSTAYMIYTSGSTGKPKGVEVPHGCVVNFLTAMQHEPGFTEVDRVLAITTMSFDISILELYLPIVCGGQVVIADQAAVSDGAKLLQLIQQHGITILQATPTTYRMLIEAGWKNHLPVKVLCGGEAFPRDLLGPLLDRCSEVWNMYGPTETTVWSSACRLTDRNAPITIGRPIANTQFYVLDDRMKEVPVGATGELYIGGAGVTHGYWNRDELTASRFVDNPFFNPFADYINYRLYRTGDLVRFRHDGQVEFVRRNDKQVKVRGHRIELGEIEQQLNLHPQIRQSMVVVREDQPGDTRLVAYYATTAGETVTASDLRQKLREALPVYMIPQYFVELESFPLTDNGKIDTKRLPAPVAIAPQEVIPPSTDDEKLLASVWQEVLDTPVLDISDNFFNLGGHSLLVMRVIAKIQEETSVQLSPQDFLIGSLEQLAARLSEQRNKHNTKTIRPDDSESLEEEPEFDHYMAAVRSATKPAQGGGLWNKVVKRIKGE